MEGGGDAKLSTHMREAPAFAGVTKIAGSGNLRDAVAAFERQMLEQTLTAHRYNQRAAAKALALTYDQLRHCMKRHGLNMEKAA
jgi:psp operon transcriptional activator